jgi:prepilin-type N-terminal cleavage/methylation domain-containing protein
MFNVNSKNNSLRGLRENKGFSLLELILAVAIFSLSSFALASMLIDSNISTKLNSERTEALFYAKEGLEAVRSIRNDDWDTFKDIDSTYGLNAYGGEWLLYEDSELIDDKFTRTVTIEDGTDETIKNISVNVAWDLTTTRVASTTLSTVFSNWISVENVVDGDGGNLVKEIDGYRIHTFTSSGTFEINMSSTVEVLVVAGGGGGGAGYGPGAGGGAGGLVYNLAKDLEPGTYTVTVGQGGNGGGVKSSGSNGGNSVFDDIIAIGGGGGGRFSAGKDGGSGGGGHWSNSAGGLALQQEEQGNNGGSSTAESDSFYCLAGGGGGAGGKGEDGLKPLGGDGGIGLEFSQFASVGGSPAGWFAGGGGSGSYTDNCGVQPGVGGAGGGGNGNSGSAGNSGVENTGGGGSGGGTHPAEETEGGNGGSGIVIIRYPI